jgi:hypothetical protein
MILHDISRCEVCGLALWRTARGDHTAQIMARGAPLGRWHHRPIAAMDRHHDPVVRVV